VSEFFNDVISWYEKNEVIVYLHLFFFFNLVENQERSLFYAT